jgi:hypothetical protein
VKKVFAISVVLMGLMLFKNASLFVNHYANLSKGAHTENNYFFSSGDKNTAEEITTGQITISSSCRNTVQKEISGGLLSITSASDLSPFADKADHALSSKKFSHYLLLILPFHSFW